MTLDNNFVLKRGWAYLEGGLILGNYSLLSKYIGFGMINCEPVTASCLYMHTIYISCMAGRIHVPRPSLKVYRLQFIMCRGTRVEWGLELSNGPRSIALLCCSVNC